MSDIGFNLASVAYWSTEEPFIDRVHTAQIWGAKDASGKDISATLTRNDNGDFTSYTNVAKLVLSVEMDPKSAATPDRYVMTWDGVGKVAISGGTIVSQTAGKVVFDYTGRDTTPSAYITISNLDGSHPVTDVHVVREDQVALFNSGEIFNPDFISKVSEWGMVRFMDWQNTNASADVSWGARATLDDSFWSRGAHPDGVPIEVMVKLCNEAHVNMYYCVPTKADDDYVNKAMTYIRDNLDPSLKVHVEWSNEVWNGIFKANGYSQDQANALWGNGGPVAHGANIYYGYRSAQISDIAHDVFSGSHAGQLVEVLAGHNGDTGVMSYMLQGVAKAGLGSVSNLFDEYAIAPYFGSEMGTAVASEDLQTIVGWANSGSAGMDAAFHELEFGGSLTLGSSLTAVIARIAKAGQIASSNGLDLIAYEGGISLSTTRWNDADTPIVQDFFNRLLADPRMGELYAKEMAAFTMAGGTTFNFFNDTGSPGDSGTWGSLASIYSDGSARYDAIMAASTKTTSIGNISNGSTVVSGPGTVTNGNTPSEALPATSGHIIGTTAADHLVASSENDTVDGEAGNDVITGSSGTVNAQGHLIEADVYMGGAGADTIVGGLGNDHIYGNAITTVAGGLDGADSISGGSGMDYIQGNAGNDTIDGGAGTDRIYGGADNDSLMGGDGNDYVQGNKGNDIVSGGNGDDVVHGGADNDVVKGDAGNDQLFGDADNDTLTGGAGLDTMTGGSGNDMFVFNAQDAAFATTGAAAWKTDEITDFSHALDKIVLDFHATQILQSSAASVATAYSSASAALAAHHGQADVAAVTVGNDTYLFWDAGGQGGAIDSALKVDHVQGGFTLADFG